MHRIKRPVRLLGLICILPVVVTGCRTIVPTKPAAAPGAPQAQHDGHVRPAANSTNAGSIVKTDFHRKVTADQSFNVHIELGRQMFRDQQYDSALNEFKKALEACSPAAGLRNNTHRIEQQALAQRKVADVLVKLGKFTEAEERYKTAVKLTPNDPRVWNNLGYCYYIQSRWADSERCLRRAVKLDPDSPLVNTNLGLTVAAGGRTADALELLSHSNGKAVGHANLGYLLASQKRDVEARDEYRQALALEPQLAIAQEALARLEKPGSSQPLVDARTTSATRAPGFASAPMQTVAVPGSTATESPTYQASAAPVQGPAQSGASTVSSLPIPNLAAPAAANPPQQVSSPGATDRELQPTSLNRSPALPPRATSNTPQPVPVPVPIQVGPGVEMSPPLPAPTLAPAVQAPAAVPAATPAAVLAPAVQAPAAVLAPAVQAPAAVPAPSASASPLPGRAATAVAARQRPDASQADIAVQLTSHAQAAVSPAPAALSEAEPEPEPATIPMPVPVAAREQHSAPKSKVPAATPQVTIRPRVSPVGAIPMPVPPPSRPAKTTTSASRSSIPMPIPVSKHLASPTTERALDATSAPAVDMGIRPLAPAQ